MFEAAARVLSISAHTDIGEVGSADEAGAANDDCCGTGARFQTTYHRILRARLLMAEDRIDEGLDILNRALEIIQEIGEGYFLPEAIRLKGELLLKKDKASADVPVLLRQAIELSAVRQTRSLELRSATSLANWLARSGEEEAARAVLSPLLSSFNQERETRDMKRARSVLKTL